MREKSAAREILRVKRRLPTGIREAGSSTKKLSVWHVLETCKPIVPLLGPIVARLLRRIANHANFLDALDAVLNRHNKSQRSAVLGCQRPAVLLIRQKGLRMQRALSIQADVVIFSRRRHVHVRRYSGVWRQILPGEIGKPSSRPMRHDTPAFYAAEARNHLDSRQSLNIGERQLDPGNAIAGSDVKRPFVGII